MTTIHGFSSEQIVPVFEKYNESGYYVAISDADRHERLDYVATIHHGIDIAEFELEARPGDYLLFFGRIHPDKGTVEAIDVAERTGLPLVIAGIVQDRSYFEQLVEPRLDGDARSATSARSGPIAVATCSVGRGHCCTSSTSTNRSASASSRRWPAGHRSSRRGAARCQRSSVTARTGSSSTTRTRRLQPSTLRAPSTESAVRASVEGRFDVERMVDDYLALYERVVELHRGTEIGIEAAR